MIPTSCNEQHRAAGLPWNALDLHRQQLSSWQEPLDASAHTRPVAAAAAAARAAKLLVCQSLAPLLHWNILLLLLLLLLLLAAAAAAETKLALIPSAPGKYLPACIQGQAVPPTSRQLDNFLPQQASHNPRPADIVSAAQSSRPKGSLAQ
jgi:hypothetical protein